MTFMTQSGLIAASTGLFFDNTSGAITPSGFRQMHENIADSMIPYDASGVFQVNTTPTGSVPTPTPTVTSTQILSSCGTTSNRSFDASKYYLVNFNLIKFTL